MNENITLEEKGLETQECPVCGGNLRIFTSVDERHYISEEAECGYCGYSEA